MNPEAILMEYREKCNWLDWEPSMLGWIQSVRERGLADDALVCLRAKWSKSYDYKFQNDWDRVYTSNPRFNNHETSILMTMTELGDKRALRLLVILEYISQMRESMRVIIRNMDDTVLEALRDGVDYQLPEAALTVRDIREALAKENPHHPLLPDISKLCERFEIIEQFAPGYALPMSCAVRFADEFKR